MFGWAKLSIRSQPLDVPGRLTHIPASADRLRHLTVHHGERQPCKRRWLRRWPRVAEALVEIARPLHNHAGPNRAAFVTQFNDGEAGVQTLYGNAQKPDSCRLSRARLLLQVLE